MTWSDAARAAALEARRMHAKKSPVDLRRMAEYEGRLWGGAYSHNRLRLTAPTSPMHKIIKSARKNYAGMRNNLGLGAIKDWTRPPQHTGERIMRAFARSKK